LPQFNLEAFLTEQRDFVVNDGFFPAMVKISIMNNEQVNDDILFLYPRDGGR
jgi:hypothetical protein